MLLSLLATAYTVFAAVPVALHKLARPATSESLVFGTTDEGNQQAHMEFRVWAPSWNPMKNLKNMRQGGLWPNGRSATVASFAGPASASMGSISIGIADDRAGGLPLPYGIDSLTGLATGVVRDAQTSDDGESVVATYASQGSGTLTMYAEGNDGREHELAQVHIVKDRVASADINTRNLERLIIPPGF
jgi:hypothetical protein